MTKCYLGIDLGATAIKFCQLHISNDNNIVIDKLHIENIDYSFWQNKNLISKKLKEIIRKKNIKYDFVSVNIPKYASIIKSTSYYINPDDDSNIEDSIYYSAMQTLPEMQDKMIWDYIYFKDYDNNKIDINVIAVKKDFIYSNMNIFKKAKINLDSIELTSTAMNNFYFANYTDYNEKISLLMDIGYTVTTVNIVYFNRPVLFWSMPFGMKSMIKIVQNEVNISENDIVAHLFENGYMKNDKLCSLAFSQFDNLLAELELPLNSFAADYDGASIDRIILSGGGAIIKNIDDYIFKSKNIHTEKIVLNKSINIDNDIKNVGINFNIAMGLCLKKYINYEKELNLSFPLSSNSVLKIFNKFGIGLTAIIIILLLNLSILNNKSVYLENVISNINNKTINLRQDNNLLKSKIESNSKVSVLVLLNQLEIVLDKNIKISKFEYDSPENIILTFSIKTKLEAEKIVDLFRNNDTYTFVSFYIKKDLIIVLKAII